MGLGGRGQRTATGRKCVHCPVVDGAADEIRIVQAENGESIEIIQSVPGSEPLHEMFRDLRLLARAEKPADALRDVHDR